MSLFMLDTDTVSFALRGHGNVGSELARHRPSEVCLSAITVAELRFGADKRRSRRIHTAINTFIGAVRVPVLLSSPSPVVTVRLFVVNASAE